MLGSRKAPGAQEQIYADGCEYETDAEPGFAGRSDSAAMLLGVPQGHHEEQRSEEHEDHGDGKESAHRSAPSVRCCRKPGALTLNIG